MHVEALIVKAFTKDPEKGNPAGVIFEKELSDAQMQTLATLLRFSESAFVSNSDLADFRVRFFTPTKEVALCGHGTIATFFALLSAGRITLGEADEVESSQETSAGVLKVICRKDGLIIMDQAKPIFYETNFDQIEIARLLGIDLESLADLPIQLVSTGSPKLIIPVKSLKDIEKIQPNLEAMRLFCANSEVRGFYPFTQETKEGSDFYARQFNPFAGIDEDPVTGVAAGALGAYTVQYGLKQKPEFVVEQGYGLGKGGKMYVTVKGSHISVGGYAVIAEKRILTV